MLEFARANQELTLHGLAKALDPALPEVLYFEGLKEEIVRHPEHAEWLVRDSLWRAIREGCPRGWRHGDSPDFDSVRTLVRVTGPLDDLGDDWRARLARVSRFLMQIEPGWMPFGPDDPQLVRAFNATGVSTR